jgi:three-Cys-motif partner protein
MRYKYGPDRQALIANVFHTLLSWFIGQKSPLPFVYLDTHAGSGQQKVADSVMAGSPVLFLQRAKELSAKVVAVLFELNAKSYDMLCRNTQHLGSLDRIIIPVLANSLTQLATAVKTYATRAHGLIYCDSCEASPSLALLEAQMTDNPELDVMLHCNVAKLRKQEGGLKQLKATLEKRDDDGHRRCNWFISPPSAQDKNWVVIYGSRSQKFVVYAALQAQYRFAHIDSPAGAAYFERALLGQPSSGTSFKPTNIKCGARLQRDSRNRIIVNDALVKFIADHAEMTSVALAKVIKCSAVTVYRVRKKYNLPRRDTR